MIRLLGILVLVLALYGALMVSDPNASSSANHQLMADRTGFYGVFTLGVGLLIITGGIDLSIGAVAALSAVVFVLCLQQGACGYVALAVVLGMGALIGMANGLLITGLRLQPFLVTLCGLFVYRGLARWATWTKGSSSSAHEVGIAGFDLGGLRFLASGKVMEVPAILILLLALAAVAAVLLHRTVYGRYLYAIGYNEQAARYAGIPTGRYKVAAYAVCSTLAALGGVLMLLDVESVNPANAGSWYELYAITGAVLGGCSLRGGEGTVPGMVLGAAVLPLLRNLSIFAGIPSDLEFTVIGLALLLGTISDELLKRLAGRGA